MCRDMISTIIGLLKSFANNTPAAAPVGGETNTDYGAGGVDSGWDGNDDDDNDDDEEEEEIHDPSSESDNKKVSRGILHNIVADMITNVWCFFLSSFSS